MFKSIENRPVFGFKYPVMDNNKLITDNLIISNLFGNYFLDIFQNQSLISNYETKSFSLQIAYNFEHKVSYNSPFTKSELQRYISDLNIKSTMSQDPFHSNFLYHLSKAQAGT